MSENNWRRPGFTIPGYARAAALKNVALGTRHSWTPEQAREWNRKNADARRARKLLSIPVDPSQPQAAT